MKKIAEDYLRRQRQNYSNYYLLHRLFLPHMNMDPTEPRD